MNRELRNDAAVHELELPGDRRVLAITGYREIQECARRPEFIRSPSDAKKRLPDLSWGRYPEDLHLNEGRQPFNTDGADHQRLRRLLAPFFTSRSVEAWRPLLRDVVDNAANALARRPYADLVAEFAIPVPLNVIAEILGIPETVRHEFEARIKVAVSPISPLSSEWQTNVRQLRQLTMTLLREKAHHEDSTLISTLIRAHRRRDVSSVEVIATVIALLAAGYETTASLISSCALALFSDRQLLSRVIAQPELVDHLVEEVLRLEPPVPVGAAGFALQATEVGGVPVRPGQFVFTMLAAANRDPAVYDDAERLRLRRDEPTHLSFGAGRHRCLGVHLGRMEAQVALQELVRRFPQMTITVDPGTLHRHGGLHLRALDRLPVAVHGPVAPDRVPDDASYATVGRP